MPQILIKPASDDLVIRDPDDQMTPLPAGGKAVEESTYWRRRLLDGDVVITDQVAAPEPAPQDDESEE